jgi:inner membrane protein
MDNLSHSVVGLALGELVHRSLPREPDAERQGTRRRLLLVSCWAASNFPDLDLFLTPLLPAPLGYLLHHRGHTHTLLYAIPQAILLWAMIRLLWPSARKLMKESPGARTGFLVVLCLGFVIHLSMDYLNPYGIHPFHPFDSHWLYGDMVFIVEPVFWITFGVPLAMMVPQRTLRFVLFALFAGIPLYFASTGFLSAGSIVMLALLALVMGALQQRAGAEGRHALIAALALTVGFIGMQGFASSQAKTAVAATLHDPASRMLDVAAWSFPSNPLCWGFVSVESNEGAGSYTLRRGVLSLMPAVLPVAGCPRSLAGPLPEKSAAAAVAFQLEEQGSLDKLRTLKNENCHFAAWLRFARAPLLGKSTATDIRFGADPHENFTTIDVAQFRQRECARFIPGWAYPRADLLTPP